MKESTSELTAKLISSLKELERSNQLKSAEANSRYKKYTDKLGSDLMNLDSKRQILDEAVSVWSAKLEDSNMAYNEALRSQGNIEAL